MTELYNKAFATITRVPEGNYLQVEWSGYASSQQYRECIHKQIELLDEFQIHKMIIDTSNFKGVGLEDQKYSNELFEKRAKDRGTRLQVGLVVSKDVFGRMSINNIMKKGDQTESSFKLFNNQKEAHDWIIGQ